MMQPLALLALFVLPVFAQNSSIFDDPVIFNDVTDLPSLTGQLAECIEECYFDLFVGVSRDFEGCQLTGDEDEEVDWKCICEGFASPEFDTPALSSENNEKTFEEFSQCGASERGCTGEEAPAAGSAGLTEYNTKVFVPAILEYCQRFGVLPNQPNATVPEVPDNSTSTSNPVPTTPPAQEGAAATLGVANGGLGLALAGFVGLVTFLV
ncbi:hypothetical protein BJ508DRAFT_358079 [Ascobolus immersus RN42]|uniref:Extracellular membrane protein CFEM domain-containing protein n=1 Tax=Ascobolus immersus RN42 TaxID=1160509 RepID=A0A3N4IJZ3_ASCIM|nr:hypothetical protein BJ508DRAFT_358079 [Ascobolus immersus RN42]